MAAQGLDAEWFEHGAAAAAELASRLQAGGTTAVLLEIPWAEHAFDAISAGPSAQLALGEVERFLAWALRGGRMLLWPLGR